MPDKILIKKLNKLASKLNVMNMAMVHHRAITRRTRINERAYIGRDV